jgi:hypothetical protein
MKINVYKTEKEMLPALADFFIKTVQILTIAERFKLSQK